MRSVCITIIIMISSHQSVNDPLQEFAHACVFARDQATQNFEMRAAPARVRIPLSSISFLSLIA